MRIISKMLKSILLITFILKYQKKIANLGALDASKLTRNGSFIPYGTQMPTEGTDVKVQLL